jgi:hypothetical protein
LKILLALGLSALLVGCSPRPTAAPPPPLPDAAVDVQWQYAAYLLTEGRPSLALGYLQPLADEHLNEISNRALLFRDLAEARLYSGDPQGAASSAAAARDQLATVPDTAQFNADDRYVYARTLDALELAGRGDLAGLRRLASDESRAPCADAWFLLGWVEEQRGQGDEMRSAYRAFLARAPQWVFLREAGVMRDHAAALSA